MFTVTDYFFNSRCSPFPERLVKNKCFWFLLSKSQIIVDGNHPPLCCKNSASLRVDLGYFTIICPLKHFMDIVFIVYDRACNIFKCDACVFFLWKGWCLDSELCCKGSWDSHAYSNPLLDMAALNKRRACSTQGWFVFHVFFSPSSSSFKHLQHILIKALAGIYFTLAVGPARPWYPSTSQLNGAVHENQISD